MGLSGMFILAKCSLSITEMNEVEHFKEFEAPAVQFLGGEISKATLKNSEYNLWPFRLLSV